MTTDPSGFVRPDIDQHTAIPTHPRTLQAAFMARFRSLPATERQDVIDLMQKFHNDLDQDKRYGAVRAAREMGV